MDGAAAREYDLIVMGSGSAGLAAALAAAAAGLSVLILEKTAKLGGTTAYSGGAIWAPANDIAAAAGLSDSVEEAKAYLLATAPEGWADCEGLRLGAFAANAGPTLRLIERKTPLRFALLSDSDLFPEVPGAKAIGRMVTPRLLRRGMIGHLAWKLRGSKLPLLFTFDEVAVRNPLTEPFSVQIRYLPKIVKRLLTGERGMGAALVIGLLKGCLDLGCQVRTNARMTGLLMAEGAVCGVTAQIAGRKTEFHSRAGVVIASGGFEWNDALLAEHFPGPVDFRASPRANEGDGLLIARSVGAAVDHMDQANFNSAIPGWYEGGIQGIGWFYHTAPNSVIVQRDGKRFFNEEDHNLGLHIDQRGPDGKPVNLPAWFITDSHFLARERVAMRIASCDPSWVVRAATFEELAGKVGIDANGLVNTVAEFNRAASGMHADVFGRQGCQPIAKAPYLAMRFNRSIISTKGGPRTDADACVLRDDGSIIEGLYCAGVAMANPLGTKAVAAGTTLGPNLTWGYIAGRHAAARLGKA